jgi:hypothetical protein
VTVVGHGPHPPERLRRWQDDLRGLPPVPPLADTLDVGERYKTLDALTTIAVTGDQSAIQAGAAPGPAAAGQRLWGRLFTQGIDWDPALKKTNRVLDQYAAGARLPDRAARKAAYARLADEFSDANVKAGRGSVVMGRGARGERMGDILLGLTLPSLEKVQDSSDRAEQVQINLQAAVALALCRAETGRYPAKLDELVPRYLPAVPIDVFTGGPLIYRPEKDGYLLYSVGVNGNDDGGRWPGDDPDGGSVLADDVRVRMPVPPPRPKKPAPKVEID